MTTQLLPQLLKVALFQLATSLEPQNNLDKIIQQVHAAKAAGAQLLVLPELHNNHYFCKNDRADKDEFAETIPGPSTRKLGQAAKEAGIVVVASLYEKADTGSYYNTAVVFETNGEIAGTYRKMHIPHDEHYYRESLYFAPGDLGFNPISTSVGKLGVLVCWDQWYPEAARMMALRGAQLLIYPTAIGWVSVDPSDEQARQLSAWQTIQRSHAIANHLPVISCNRVGLELETNPIDPTDLKNIDFWGHSFISGQQGEYLAEAGKGADVLLTAEINLTRTEELRKIWPFFEDRRVDSYGEICRKQPTCR